MYTTGKKISDSLITAYTAIAMIKKDPLPIFIKLLKDHDAIESLCAEDEELG